MEPMIQVQFLVVQFAFHLAKILLIEDFIIILWIIISVFFLV